MSASFYKWIIECFNNKVLPVFLDLFVMQSAFSHKKNDSSFGLTEGESFLSLFVNKQVPAAFFRVAEDTQNLFAIWLECPGTPEIDACRLADIGQQIIKRVQIAAVPGREAENLGEIGVRIVIQPRGREYDRLHLAPSLSYSSVKVL